MNRFLTTIVLSLLCAAAVAQPKAQDLSNIDPRLTNGFVMTPQKLTAEFFKGDTPKSARGTSLIKLSTGLRTSQRTAVSGASAKYTFTIIPWFSYSGSWISDNIKNVPESLGPTLRYSQDQYDIHLLMAAELKKRLENQFYTRENMSNNILGTRDELLREEYDIVAKMSIETSDGKDAAALQKWDDLVASAVKAKSWAMLAKRVK